MKVVTDTASNLSAERAAQLGVEVVPFHLKFMDKNYLDGVDLKPEGLYQLYAQHPHELTSTSQPSVGDFMGVYEKYGEEEILSIHLSSGLSGAYSSAQSAAHLVSDERITVLDTKMVGPALGWMVEVAAHCAQKGWSKEEILEALQEMRENMITMVSFSDLYYLIHSGRISHLRGILASLLKIKPIIGMNDVDGRYSDLGKEITMSRVTHKMANLVFEKFGKQKLRLRLMHGNNLPGAELLREAVNRILDCVEEQMVAVTPVLGAHAGPTVIGLAAMPEALISKLMS